jgi:regulator of RNase E activity RraB
MPFIASGDVNEDRIEFEFCSMWDGFAKTAVFYRTEADVYHVLLDENDSCIIPHEVLAEPGPLYFGVFGAKDDRVRTSEIIQYTIKQGAITEATKIPDPTPDIYAQLLATFKKGVYETAVKLGFEGTEAEWLESLKGEKGETPKITAVARINTTARPIVTLEYNEEENEYAFTFGLPKGEKGAKGDNGDSAYETAVKLGFEGTEAEWLESLKGETGEAGEAGKNATINGYNALFMKGVNDIIVTGTGDEIVISHDCTYVEAKTDSLREPEEGDFAYGTAADYFVMGRHYYFDNPMELIEIKRMSFAPYLCNHDTTLTFAAAHSGFTLVLPENCHWAFEAPPTFEAGHIYTLDFKPIFLRKKTEPEANVVGFMVSCVEGVTPFYE